MLYLYEFDLNFQDQTYKWAILTSIGCKNFTITIANRYEVRYLPSYGATANAVHRDFCLHFQGHEISNVTMWKTVKATLE